MIYNIDNKMSKFFSKVYMWMFIGLLISGITAYYTFINTSLLKFVYQFYSIICIVEIIVVIAFSTLKNKVSPNVAKILFIVYSVLSGLTLSSIFIVYKLGSILMVFVSSALMFGMLAIYGYVTKQNLSSMGKILFFALLAVIIMSIVNIFIVNSTFGVIISVISIMIFLGLTAYDMQMLKNIYNYYLNDEEELNKAAIYGALNLYLDFINIFLEMLRLFGKKNN